MYEKPCIMYIGFSMIHVRLNAIEMTGFPIQNLVRIDSNAYAGTSPAKDAYSDTSPC